MTVILHIYSKEIEDEIKMQNCEVTNKYAKTSFTNFIFYQQQYLFLLDEMSKTSWLHLEFWRKLLIILKGI